MIYLELFWAFFKIGLFSIGGGYAALPLIQEQIVDKYHWITPEVYADVITISQMTPGPIAINSATFVGVKVGGPLGAVVATLAFILPSVIIISIIGYLYYKYRKLSVLKSVLTGLRPAVVGLIASAGISIIILSFWKSGQVSLNLGDINIFSVIVFASSLFVMRKYKSNPILIMSIAGLAGGFFYSIIGR
ncbi:MAG: chromate transporter [Clostridiales bacterium GWF2_36_10]|nr:MAG: chromate transporter [Clostridiales bacterium GWF2_36_10]HAN22023.1 chromate transporter [Clostridiales bacterium]